MSPGGAFAREHPVPLNFQLPQGTLPVAWQHWFCGNPGLGYRPLRRLVPDDLSDRNQRKRLSDYRSVMSALDSYLTDQQRLDKPTIVQASVMFQQAFKAAQLSSKTPHDYERRLSQLAWISFVRVFKQKSAAENTENDQ